jgi:sugar-specific transcriptional regulator TrmB
MSVKSLSKDDASTENTSGDLKKLGFTEYEAKVYVQLLGMPPSTAYEISKQAGVPRPNTYSALDSLARRGAVLPVRENPTCYVAAKPRELLDNIARQTRSLCAGLTERLEAVTPRTDDHYVWSLRGDQAVHEHIDILIGQSSEAVWIKAADHVLRRHADQLREAAVERGVRLLIVLFGKDADEFRYTDKCQVYIHENNGVRMGTADNLFTLAIDYREMLTANVEGDVIAAHSKNFPIVTMALSLIRHDYYMAEIFTKFGKQIDEEFGPYLRDLRLPSFTPEQVASFKKNTGVA